MRFLKMHGTGNDFVVVQTQGDERDWPALARRVCDRHFGVGADGLLLALPAPDADVAMRIFNPDGSEAEMCGNGIRCLVKFAVEEGLVRPRQELVTVATVAGPRPCRFALEDGKVTSVRVGMGNPRFAPADLPMAIGRAAGPGGSGTKEMAPPIRDYPLEVAGRRLAVTCLSMGNPHAVHFAARPVAAFPLEEIGPQVERHPLFPQRVNFEVARILGRELMEVRVWERGAGPTLACGTGACAAVVAARLHSLVDDAVEARLPGGSLTIEWDGQGEVFLTGPSETVFRGEWPE